ncbi:MAG: GHKL domain-containing protein [Chloroflexi bacterium]|nr:MAG: GHKL domain-containing protein [Chloroflexota bacterium]
MRVSSAAVAARSGLEAGELRTLKQRIEELEAHVRFGEQRRRAMLHIMMDLTETNRRLSDQRRAMIHIMGDLRDTTEEIRRREQELRDKQEQLVQTAKLATIGELTTGVAHELNDPLNNIGLYIGNVLDLMVLETWDSERIERDLGRAKQQVAKATEIINHLRTFGRAAPRQREPVEINGVIESSVSLFSEQFRLREVELVLELAAENPSVLGNPIQLEQVLLNLLNNARDAVAGSDEKRIRVSSRVGQGWVRVMVQDSGPGVPKELEERIFDPFFTTKEVGQGTGLGLSIVYGIVNDHEGQIYLDRTTQGARFVMELPLESKAV